MKWVHPNHLQGRASLSHRSYGKLQCSACLSAFRGRYYHQSGESPQGEELRPCDALYRQDRRSWTPALLPSMVRGCSQSLMWCDAQRCHSDSKAETHSHPPNQEATHCPKEPRGLHGSTAVLWFHVQEVHRADCRFPWKADQKSRKGSLLSKKQ